MAKHYLSHQAGKKNFALKGIWVLVILAVIFAVILVRFAISGSKTNSGNDMPNNDEAYAIAKQYIKPTIKFKPVSFPESDYQCAQKPDSTYIIKSYAESKNQAGGKGIITFEITMKFIGGLTTDKSSWKVLNIIEN